MSNQIKKLYEFGPFRLDVQEKICLRDRETIPLTPKAFELLTFLVERSGHLVTKDELMNQVWPDCSVEESNLSHNIYLIRKALGEDSQGRQYIETVPKHGYRFTAEVKQVELPVPPPELIIEEHTRAHVVVEEDISDYPIREEGIQQAGGASVSRRNRIKPSLLIASLLTILAVVPAYLYLSSQWSNQQGPSLGINSVAVLPFKTLGLEGNKESLDLGMADSMIIRLSSLRRLTVLPTGAVSRYVGRDYDPLAAGRELGVDSVLTGTVQRSGDRVRVTLQLIRVSNGQTIWSHKIDDIFSNIFDLQDSISVQAANTLLPQLSGEEQKQVAKRFTTSSEAYQLYLMGVYFWGQRTEEGLVKAADYFRQAVEKDPNYALAYALMADCYYLMGYYNYKPFSPEEAREKAKAAALRALSLDESLAEGHAALGSVKFSLKDIKGAGDEYRRAISLNPNIAMAHQRYAWLFLRAGQYQEALQHMRKAQMLDPLSAPINTSLGQMLVMGGQPDEAIKFIRRAIDINPSEPLSYFFLGDAYAQKGMSEEAHRAFERGRELSQNGIDGLERIAMIYASSGRRTEAVNMLIDLQKLAQKGNAEPYYIALVHAALGQEDKAFEWLEQSLRNTYFFRILLRFDRNLDTLRPDPRFEDLLKRYSLDPPITDSST